MRCLASSERVWSGTTGKHSPYHLSSNPNDAIFIHGQESKREKLALPCSTVNQSDASHLWASVISCMRKKAVNNFFWVCSAALWCSKNSRPSWVGDRRALATGRDMANYLLMYCHVTARPFPSCSPTGMPGTHGLPRECQLGFGGGNGCLHHCT